MRVVVNASTNAFVSLHATNTKGRNAKRQNDDINNFDLIFFLHYVFLFFFCLGYLHLSSLIYLVKKVTITFPMEFRCEPKGIKKLLSNRSINSLQWFNVPFRRTNRIVRHFILLFSALFSVSIARVHAIDKFLRRTWWRALVRFGCATNRKMSRMYRSKWWKVWHGEPTECSVHLGTTQKIEISMVVRWAICGPGIEAIYSPTKLDHNFSFSFFLTFSIDFASSIIHCSWRKCGRKINHCGRQQCLRLHSKSNDNDSNRRSERHCHCLLPNYTKQKSCFLTKWIIGSNATNNKWATHIDGHLVNVAKFHSEDNLFAQPSMCYAVNTNTND